jgi:hypothetical protein
VVEMLTTALQNSLSPSPSVGPVFFGETLAAVRSALGDGEHATCYGRLKDTWCSSAICYRDGTYTVVLTFLNVLPTLTDIVVVRRHAHLEFLDAYSADLQRTHLVRWKWEGAHIVHFPPPKQVAGWKTIAYTDREASYRRAEFGATFYGRHGSLTAVEFGEE